VTVQNAEASCALGALGAVPEKTGSNGGWMEKLMNETGLKNDADFFFVVFWVPKDCMP
jgi:hypothetical protein